LLDFAPVFVEVARRAKLVVLHLGDPPWAPEYMATIAATSLPVFQICF
jgi:hypothetical protein